jgi:hypothetical protein
MCKIPFGDFHTHIMVLKKHKNKGERGTNLSGYAVQQVPQKKAVLEQCGTYSEWRIKNICIEEEQHSARV